MSRRSTRTAFIVLLSLTVVTAACSSDDSDRATSDGERPATDGRSPSPESVAASTDTDDRTDDDDADDSTRGDDDGGDPDGLSAAVAPAEMPKLSDHVTCPEATRPVHDSEDLHDALETAQPGDVIELAAGTYEGKFVASTEATESAPIYVCGPRDAVIDGEGIKGGYAFHLDGASGWRLVGFTVRNAQKGVVADGVTNAIIESLLVEDIGDEAIHLRSFSTDNIVRGNEIRDTGQRRAKFGEGVYVGSAQSNWCTHSDCEPDRSDGNVIEGNLIYGTTSESVDLKEGTTGGSVRNNVFGGAALSGADSWVDAKGNDWIIDGNVGFDSPTDGFQMHQILEDWGTGNIFRGNRAAVNGEGYGFATTNTVGNVISCSNTVTAADRGFADVDCTT